MICITLQEDADAVRHDSLLDFKKQHFFARPYSSSENNYFFATDKIWMSSYNAVTVKTSDASLYTVSTSRNLSIVVHFTF